MPHAIIEYSQSLAESAKHKISPESLMASVFDGAKHSKLFDAADIKVRTIAFEHHLSGEIPETNDRPFIHVTMKILSGRTLEQRTHLSECVMAALEQLKLESLSLTVEILDIEKASYIKRLK